MTPARLWLVRIASFLLDNWQLLLRVGIRLAVAALFVGFAALVLFSLIPDRMKYIEDFVATKTIKTSELGAAFLFEKLREANLIRYRPTTADIEYAPPDLLQRQRLGGAQAGDWTPLIDAAGKPIDAEVIEYLHQLHSHRSGIGNQVRREIATWNQGRRVAAIRDSFIPADFPLRDHPVVFDGDIANTWEVSASYQIDGQRVAVPQSAEDGLSYDHFGFLGWEHRKAKPRAPIGGWRRVVATNDDDRIRFERRYDAATSAVTVDVLGERYEVVSGADERVKWRFCPDGRPVTGQCPGGASAIAYRLRLQPNGQSPVTIEVSPVREIPKPLRGFTGARFDTGGCTPASDGNPGVCSGWVGFRGSDTLMVRCGTRMQALECRLLWKDRLGRKPVRAEDVRLALLTADEEPLTVAARDDEGPRSLEERAADRGNDGSAPTRIANELGLIPSIGITSRDRSGLAAEWLRQNDGRSPPPLSLTVRADLQRLGLKALQAQLDGGRHLPTRFNDRRHAVLMILDAEDDDKKGASRRRGDILVSAELPQASFGKSMWNLLGLTTWSPAQSPLVPHAWRGIGNATAPGSTFKALTALALIRRTVERNQDRSGPLFETIRGVRNWKKAPAMKLPEGVRLESNRVVIPRVKYKTWSNTPCWKDPSGERVWSTERRVCNFTNEYHKQALMSPKSSGCPPLSRHAMKRTQYGLCEATIMSMNSWFIATALGMDGDAAQQWGAKETSLEAGQEPEKPSLLTMAERILPKSARDLAGFKHPASLATGRFRAEPVRLGLARADYDYLFKLGLNSIGQDAQASPLAVATLYASIATGCRVEPRLLPGQARRPCLPLFFDKDPKREQRALKLMREYLVPGLKGVVNAPHGTARRAFSTSKQRRYVRAKTGTAEFSDRGVHLRTGWLAGWVEKEGSGGLGRGFAFACMITHVGRGGSGGNVCGPAVRRFLDSLQTYKPGGQG